MCPSAPRVCSEPGGQKPVLSLSLDRIDNTKSPLVQELASCRLDDNHWWPSSLPQIDMINRSLCGKYHGNCSIDICCLSLFISHYILCLICSFLSIIKRLVCFVGLYWIFVWLTHSNVFPRDHFVHAPSQWETMLHCNVVPHWLGACTKWSLISW